MSSDHDPFLLDKLADGGYDVVCWDDLAELGMIEPRWYTSSRRRDMGRRIQTPRWVAFLNGAEHGNNHRTRRDAALALFWRHVDDNGKHDVSGAISRRKRRIQENVHHG